MIQKAIVFFGRNVTVACDANCDKAWGINQRPCVQLSADPDDVAYIADDELGMAPEDPGTYEGGDAKPTQRPMTGDAMNRWCVRECERHTFLPEPLPDLSHRLYNLPSSDPAVSAPPEGGR